MQKDIQAGIKEKIRITARWPALMGIDDAAEYLSISPKTIRNKLSDKSSPFPIKPRRYGRRVMFSKEDLDEFINQLE